MCFDTELLSVDNSKEATNESFVLLTLSLCTPGN